jgi:hypothetical protein
MQKTEGGPSMTWLSQVTDINSKEKGKSKYVGLQPCMEILGGKHAKDGVPVTLKVRDSLFQS